MLHLKFGCQSCQIEEADFLIARKGKKLSIAGRWPVEQHPAPAYIPTGLRGFYSQAVITHNAGFQLAALLYLRTLIEQFWRSLGLAVAEGRPTGEELGSLYKDTLPQEFNERFPSLLDIYNVISGALHTANADAQVFADSLARIERHFDARRLFDLESAAAGLDP